MLTSELINEGDFLGGALEQKRSHATQQRSITKQTAKISE